MENRPTHPALTSSGCRFGEAFSDHVLMAHHERGKWTSMVLMEYGHLHMAPSNCALHYGQTVFEGLKAYLSPDGSPLLFRPLKHFQRMNKSAERLCMPPIPADLFLRGIEELVEADRAWIPRLPQHSLYLRPLYFATDEALGVRESESHTFLVLGSPAGAYHASSISLWLSRENVRAFPGGTGDVKTPGNYGAALLATRKARKRGFDDVLWVDSEKRAFVEECGTMNVFFVIRDTVVTPPLSGTILPGVTRDSVLHLLKERGIPFEIRPVSVAELSKHHRSGALRECFGTGTAASIVPVTRIGTDEGSLELPTPPKDGLAARLERQLHAIRTGLSAGPPNWVTRI